MVAGAKLLGLSNLPLEIIIFGGLGMLLSLTMRKKIMTSLGHKTQSYRSDDFLTLNTAIAPGGTATISYQGTNWTAVNDSGVPLAVGSRVKIVRTEGVRLFLMPGE